jgi:hypothetical protein
MNLKEKIFLGLFCAAALVNPITLQIATTPNLQTKLSQAEAEQVLEEEKKNLEITIPVEYQWGTTDNDWYFAALARHPDRETAVIFADSKNIDRVLIRHELYHLYKAGGISTLVKVGRNPKETRAVLDDLFKDPTKVISLGYLLYYEPAANLYSITGIRL